MSRQLTEEEAQGLIASAPNKRSVYNWHKWLDGNWHQVLSGVDYHCTDMSFRNLLYLKKIGHVHEIREPFLMMIFLIR